MATAPCVWYMEQCEPLEGLEGEGMILERLVLGLGYEVPPVSQ